jgi:hypothetical protein
VTNMIKIRGDDIAGLIAGVLWKEMKHGELHPDTTAKAVADALSRLTTPPLPEEIAGLIERANKTAKCVYLIGDEGPCADVSDCILKLVAALRTLALENAGLRRELETERPTVSDEAPILI